MVLLVVHVGRAGNAPPDIVLALSYERQMKTVPVGMIDIDLAKYLFTCHIVEPCSVR